MKNSKTMAYINLYSVLRNIEDLCRLDEYAKEIIKDENISISFNIKGGVSAALVFKNGTCTFIPNRKKARIRLYFTSFEHLNKMVDGEAMPIPLSGLLKISFLTKKFMKLSERLEFYLRPDEKLLKDPKFMSIHTELLLYTAVNAAAQFANADPVGRLIAEDIADGQVAVEIEDGPCVYVEVNNGVIKVAKGQSQAPRARMNFADTEAAYGLLSGNIDAYTCIASSKLSLSGYIPMLDNINKLLFHIAAYLR